MKKLSNEIYTLVDENFLSQFSGTQRQVLENAYYRYYLTICERIKRTPLEKVVFFTNMRRRRFRFYQLCCPYCGVTEIMVVDNRISKSGDFNYCPHCGKGSVEQIVFNQLARFTRIAYINNVGIAVYAAKYPKKDIRLIGYDGYQMELVELTSIVEVILRDFFNALFHMSYYGVKNSYIEKMTNKYTGNDFMNIEKANDHYKKALSIDIKSSLSTDIWNDLIDITNMRNMMIHNNGMIDSRFRNTKTFERLRNSIDDNLLFLDQKMIEHYYNTVSKTAEIISGIFRTKYKELKNAMIAMHHFTSSDLNLVLNQTTKRP